MSSKTAIYAFSGDPITHGHIDVVARASKMFDKIVVGVGSNPDKKYLFSLEERTELAKQALKNIKNVVVKSFSGLLVDFAYKNNAATIIKGVRNAVDFEYELNLCRMGESQQLGIETILLLADPKLAHVSSSAVKNLQKEHGFVHQHVPIIVKQALERKMAHQVFLGVTGSIATQKSWVCEQIMQYCALKNSEAYHINMDLLGHQILDQISAPSFKIVKTELISSFGKKVFNRGQTKVDRKKLGEIVFKDAQLLKKLNQIMMTPILVLLKQELFNKRGLIILESALFAELELGYLVNNNFLLTSVSLAKQQEILLSRGFNLDQVQRRIDSQFTIAKKKSILKSWIAKDGGNLWEITESRMDSGQTSAVFSKIIRNLQLNKL